MPNEKKIAKCKEMLDQAREAADRYWSICSSYPSRKTTRHSAR